MYILVTFFILRCTMRLAHFLSSNDDVVDVEKPKIKIINYDSLVHNAVLFQFVNDGYWRRVAPFLNGGGDEKKI